MKILKVSDEWNEGEALLCERHFRWLEKYIESARNQGVCVESQTTKVKGCRFCSSDKHGFSRWSGAMFPIWRGFKQDEKVNESR